MKDKFKSGVGTFECRECGSTLDVECSRGAAPLAEVAYCDECDVQYARNRDPVAEEDAHREDGIRVVETRRENTDEYETYYCEQCEQEHENTVPAEEFRSPDMEVVGYDMTNLDCECGRHIDITGWSVGEQLECKCGRVFELALIRSPKK